MCRRAREFEPKQQFVHKKRHKGSVTARKTNLASLSVVMPSFLAQLPDPAPNGVATTANHSQPTATTAAPSQPPQPRPPAPPQHHRSTTTAQLPSQQSPPARHHLLTIILAAVSFFHFFDFSFCCSFLVPAATSSIRVLWFLAVLLCTIWPWQQGHDCWTSPAQTNLARLGSARLGLAWLGSARLGSAWLSSDRIGSTPQHGLTQLGA
jgi:hypothetical protein